MKCISLLESSGSLSDFIVETEISCKGFWEINGKFVGNIPG